MNLINKLYALLDTIYRVEYADIVEAHVAKSNGSYQLFVDHLRVKDPSKVRMNRIRTELNDVDIPSIEDPNQGIRNTTLNYKRRITYILGRVFEDIPVMERTIEYENGERKKREIQY